HQLAGRGGGGGRPAGRRGRRRRAHEVRQRAGGQALRQRLGIDRDGRGRRGGGALGGRRTPAEQPRGEAGGEEVPPVDRVAIVEEEALAEERGVAVVAGLLAGHLCAFWQRRVENRPSHLRHEEVLQLGLDR